MTTFLCLASYYKGAEFMRECKRQGIKTILLAAEKYQHEEWPWEAIDEKFFLPDLAKQPDITRAVSYLARHRDIDRIIPLDDYDVETAARLREHLRLPGMGDTTARHFRDKLAMRVQARDNDVRVPDFVHVLNHAQIQQFMDSVPAPWVLKPRSEAGSVGIKKLHTPAELWQFVESMGDLQSYHLLERYVPGDVYHVDSIVYDNQVLFSQPHRYGTPPFNIWNEGGVFSSLTMTPDDPAAGEIMGMNEKVIKAMGLVRGVTHAEFIRGREDGKLYFLEMAARVGGANIDVLVEAASGINLWHEWVKLELAYLNQQPYSVPTRRHDYAGLMVCLSRQETPDLSHYNEPEVVWRLRKHHHAGLCVCSWDHHRVAHLVPHYLGQLGQDFLGVLPPSETAA